MGTRHLTCVYQDGQYKLAQYGQWDGYPSGQGVTVLAFLRDKLVGNEAKFVERLNACFTATHEQVEQWYKEVGHTRTDGFVDCAVADLFSKRFPSLSRDTGAEILSLIFDSTEPVPLRPDLDFAADSLMCEFLYLIDLDKRTLEVYEGFNKEPLSGTDRFFFLMEKIRTPGDYKGAEQYYPVKLRASFSVDSLPDGQEFTDAFREPEEGEASAAESVEES